MADLLEEDLTAPTIDDLSMEGMDPDIMELINPLLARRKALATTYNSQLNDFNRLTQSAEKAQAGGGLSAGQGVASVLVGLLPTLVAGAFGGKRAAGAAAASGAQGIGTYQALERESQKADLQRLLGLSKQQQQLLSQTANQATGVDKAITSTVANRQNTKDRLENSKNIADMNNATRMLGLEMNNGIRQAMLANKQAPTRPEMAAAMEALDKGEKPDVSNLTADERKELLNFKASLQRDKSQTRLQEELDLKESKFKAETTSGILNNLPGLTPTKQETKAANDARSAMMGIERNATQLEKSLEKDGYSYFGDTGAAQQRAFSSLVDQVRLLKNQGANFTFMERGLNVDQISGGADLANFWDSILKTGIYGRDPVTALRNFKSEMEQQTQTIELTNKFYNPNSYYSDTLIKQIAATKGREAAKALLEARKKRGEQ